jgi:hypothetical protein
MKRSERGAAAAAAKGVELGQTIAASAVVGERTSTEGTVEVSERSGEAKLHDDC